MPKSKRSKKRRAKLDKENKKLVLWSRKYIKKHKDESMLHFQGVKDD
jgi:hypothetical protein